MLPDGDPDADGLTREQGRWLLGAALALGVAVLLVALLATGASHLLGLGPETGEPPDAAFSFETELRGGGVAVAVTSEGPEAANPEDLVVEVNGDRRGTWGDLGGEGPDVVAPGHSLVLTEVSSDDVVEIFWEGGDRTRLDRGIVTDPRAGG